MNRTLCAVGFAATLCNVGRELLGSVAGVGFFHYGPRLWMVGEIEPVMATIPIRVPGCGFMPPGRITRLGGSRDGAPRELGFP